MGHSKDDPDWPQMKSACGVLDPLDMPLATGVVPGNMSDDSLYVPVIQAVQQSFGTDGRNYVGDCKMVALASRAFVAAGNDFYLWPLCPGPGIRDCFTVDTLLARQQMPGRSLRTIILVPARGGPGRAVGTWEHPGSSPDSRCVPMFPALSKLEPRCRCSITSRGVRTQSRHVNNDAHSWTHAQTIPPLGKEQAYRQARSHHGSSFLHASLVAVARRGNMGTECEAAGGRRIQGVPTFPVGDAGSVGARRHIHPGFPVWRQESLLPLEMIQGRPRGAVTPRSGAFRATWALPKRPFSTGGS